MTCISTPFPYMSSTSDHLGAFTSSAFFHKLNNFLDAVERRGSMDDSRGSEFFMPEGGTKHAPDSPASGVDTQPERFMDDTFSGTTFWRQYSVLVKRDISTARRDPSLYLVQVLLSIILSLCIGAVFSGRKTLRINNLISAVPSSLLWIILLMAYLQVSKVCLALPRLVVTIPSHLHQRNSVSPHTLLLYLPFDAPPFNIAIGASSEQRGCPI
jgi:hypothetical protein